MCEPPHTQVIEVAHAAEIPSWDRVHPENLINFYADKWEVDRQKLFDVIECESSFVEDNNTGDGGRARGLAQIRRDYFPEVSDKEADDPDYALNFIAKAWHDGHTNWWSCY